MYPKLPPEELYKLGLKLVPADLVITNARIFNSITGEFIDNQCLWIKEGWIGYVGPDDDPMVNRNTRFIDVKGKTLLPGLIEAHTHIISLIGIEEFVRYIIPSGTTTVITETIELATVAGADGFELLVKALSHQPIRFFHTLAPLAAVSRELEVYAPAQVVYEEFLKDQSCLGIGEVYWSNALMQGEQGDRVRRLTRLALSMDKRVEGHSAGSSGGKLQAYTSLGISSCHEPITEEEVLERLRLGYWVMIRQGAVRKELDAVAPIFQRPVDHRRLIISTDSMDPEGFITEGSLDAAVRRAIELGIPVHKVYQAVTINVAEHFRLDHLIGFLGPGKLADLVVIPSPDDYRPEMVMREGTIIFENGQLMSLPRRTEFPDWMFKTVVIDSQPDFSIPTQGKYRAIEMVTRLVTRETIVDFSKPEDSKDVIMAIAIERTGRGGVFSGFIKGFGLKQGACGSTMCWDSTDMIIVGTDAKSITTVINRLKQIGGGTVYAIGRKIIAEYQAPLCGLVSLEPMEKARQKIKALEQALHDSGGVPWEKPMLSLVTLGSAAIPHLRITHEGYVRLKDFALLDIKPSSI